ncbi:MAG: flagellar hook protein FlgE [Fimbriimonas ginsengisoli]|uniref:Flagellar hook protein FlgE n=1 Tax=Fimbriimonas ginsengisoli TaxID=1005039 RepID=A0A931PSV4_FIMGI|nr:flagellar hook protein FlgE [Fimbriimonas ginsengisoli]
MLQALLASVASIKAQQTRMNVIGSDLANVNTTAYKGSRVTFQDMIAQTLQGATRPSATLGGRNPIQFGLGVLVAGTDVNNEQGSLNATNRPTDLAIQGSGFFVVSNGDNLAYSRDGAFALDANGDLVQSATGERLVGWTADSFGNIDTSVPVSAASSLNVPVGRLNAVQQTTQVDMAGNLNAGAVATDVWTTQVRVYDALGGPHDLTVQFTNHTAPPAAGAPAGAASSWDWSAFEGSVATGTPIGDSTSAGNAPVYFDSGGLIVNPAQLGAITVPAGATGSAAFDVNLDFTRIGQLNAPTQVAAADQNGFPPGSLQGFSVGTDGVITGIFTNGLTRSLGQIALAIFPNPNGLERLGSNLWRNTDNSGISVVGAPRSGGRGSINSGFLEQSNIDMGSEFTDLIVTQRGFQANTKIVTTVDEMLQDLINMKR